MIPTLFHKIASALRERCYLSLEMLALRHQLAVLERSVKRPQFSPLDRCLWIVLSTLGTFGEACLHPATDASPIERAEERGLTASRVVIRQQDALLVRTGPLPETIYVEAKRRLELAG
jgi:hypothetical protein